MGNFVGNIFDGMKLLSGKGGGPNAMLMVTHL